MQGTSVIAFGKSNQRGAVSGIARPSLGDVNAAITNVFKDIRPKKTWAALSELLGVGERVAKHRVAGSRAYSAEEIAQLLRSEEGFHFLVALMGSSAPRWWHWCQLIMRVATVRRQRAMIANELEEALNADTNLAATIDRADAALSLHGENFLRPGVAQYGAATLVPNSPVAAAAKPKLRTVG